MPTTNPFSKNLLKLIDQIEDPKVREREHRLIQSILKRKVRSVDDLKPILAKGTKRQKLACCWIVSELGKKRHAALLLPLLEKSGVDPTLRIQAAAALSILQSRSSKKALFSVLVDAKTVGQRHAAAYALTWFEDEEVGEALVEVLCDKDEDKQVRAQAAEGVGYNMSSSDKRKKPYKNATNALIESLEDKSAQVRFWSAFALGCLSCRAAIPALRKLKRNDRTVISGWWSVGEEAEDAIRVILGQQPKDRETK